MYTKPLFFYVRRWRNLGKNSIHRKYWLRKLLRHPVLLRLDRIEKILTPKTDTGFGEQLKNDLLKLIFKATAWKNIPGVPVRRTYTIRWAHSLPWVFHRR